MFKPKTTVVIGIIGEYADRHKVHPFDPRIMPVVYGGSKRFIAVDAMVYPFRYKTVDTKYNMYVYNEENSSMYSVKYDIKRLNSFDKAGCTFPWEPKNA